MQSTFLFLSDLLTYRTGWYTSTNLDGSQEKLHVKQKIAMYLAPYSDVWEDYSGEVDWDTLPEIPDICIATGCPPTPWIWEEIERLEQEKGMLDSLVTCGTANATKPQLKQLNDSMTVRLNHWQHDSRLILSRMGHKRRL